MIPNGNGLAAPVLFGPESGYGHSGAVFDEAFSDGAFRSHWKPLAQALHQIGPDELRVRQANARRILREHGTAHNFLGDHEGLDRPFELDLVPFIFPPDEWSTLERGLLQRTRLFNRALADLYGPRRLITADILPSSVVQANPLFLRSCVGIQPPAKVFLFLHAIDLARSADGRWWVLADHAQISEGLGYVIENRGLASRLVPEAFRARPVRGLEPFCHFIRESLHTFNPEAGEQRNVVVLAGAPGSQNYFEHAFLARHLRYPLIEGEDLTVRGERVFLKTLSGLQPVQVILRQLSDALTDPLELDPHSKEGVPGLLEAVRAGRVVVANAMGSGLMGAPALLAFLPSMCRFLLGEDLFLPSVATWWCGQSRERDFVLKQLDRLTVRAAFTASATERVSRPPASEIESMHLASALSHGPRHYVGQERVELSHVPAFVGSGLASRPMSFRAYVCWAGDRGMVLPGGLTRVWTPAELFSPARQSGGCSKDTWVLSNGCVDPEAGGGSQPEASVCGRAGAELPSRVAENLFWLGRYLERLEDTVRVVRCALARLLGKTREENSPELTASALLMMRLDLLPASQAGTLETVQLEKGILGLVHQTHRLGTVRDIIGRLRRIALVVRDRFSNDTWRIFNKLQSDPDTDRNSASHAMQLLNTIVFDLAAFSGLQMENMTRGPGWRFLDLGRRLERAVNMITLGQAVIELEGTGHCMAELMLEIADSTMTHRRRYFATPQAATVLDLLWLVEDNPRSLVYQLNTVASHLDHLPEVFASDPSLPGMDGLRRSLETMRNMSLEMLSAPRALDASGPIVPELLEVARQMRGLSDDLTHRYFSHSLARCSSM